MPWGIFQTSAPPTSLPPPPPPKKKKYVLIVKKMEKNEIWNYQFLYEKENNVGKVIWSFWGSNKIFSQV